MDLEIKPNEIYQCNCVELMKAMGSNCVDLTVTSPPYDNLRDYGKDFTGWGEHIWKPCLDNIKRLLKDGGVCVWVGLMGTCLCV